MRMMLSYSLEILPLATYVEIWSCLEALLLPFLLRAHFSRPAIYT